MKENRISLFPFTILQEKKRIKKIQKKCVACICTFFAFFKKKFSCSFSFFFFVVLFFPLFKSLKNVYSLLFLVCFANLKKKKKNIVTYLGTFLFSPHSKILETKLRNINVNRDFFFSFIRFFRNNCVSVYLGKKNQFW